MHSHIHTRASLVARRRQEPRTRLCSCTCERTRDLPTAHERLSFSLPRALSLSLSLSLSLLLFLSLPSRVRKSWRGKESVHRLVLAHFAVRSFGLPGALRLKLNRGSLLPCGPPPPPPPPPPATTKRRRAAPLQPVVRTCGKLRTVRKQSASSPREIRLAR